MDLSKLLDFIKAHLDLAALEKELMAKLVKPLLTSTVMPKLDALKADLLSGKIDLIPGTTLDNTALAALVGKIEEELQKAIDGL